MIEPSADMSIDELLGYLFKEKSHFLWTPMATWLASSRRFTAFVMTFRDKVRKKLRATSEIESLLDLRLELETAYLLLQERSINLDYEPLPIGQIRGPDFAVTFTTTTPFMMEVTRLRMVKESTGGLAQTREPAPGPHAAPIRPAAGESLADMVCSKLGQLLPQRTNILLVGVEAPGATPDSLHSALLQLQLGAERDDPAIVKRHRFRDRTDFFRHFQRLSELIVRGPHGQTGEPVIGWVNPQGKYPLSARIRTVLYRSLRV
jgi:hypothetical protein